jgi:hypothetical protein
MEQIRKVWKEIRDWFASLRKGKASVVIPPAAPEKEDPVYHTMQDDKHNGNHPV